MWVRECGVRGCLVVAIGAECRQLGTREQAGGMFSDIDSGGDGEQNAPPRGLRTAIEGHYRRVLCILPFPLMCSKYSKFQHSTPQPQVLPGV